MTRIGRSTLHFDGYHVPGDVDLLYRGTEVVPLEPRAVRLLRYLLVHASRVVPKHELLEEVWADVFTTDGVLKKAISQIRRAVGDDAEEPRYVVTYHGRGYRFIAPVRRVDAVVRRRGTLPPETPLPTATELVPEYDQFLGRESQLAVLRAEFASAVKGNPRPVIVTGEPGIGKTQLARHFRRWAREQHATTLYGRFVDYRGSRVGPHQLFLELLAQAVQGVGGDGDLRGELAQRCGISLPAELFAGGDAASRLTVGMPDRFRFAVPIARCFRALAVTRPIVMVLDDLQWADEVSLDVIGCLMRLLDSEALMLILLVRNQEEQAESVRTWLEEHAVQRSYTTLRLTGLDEASSNDVVGAVFKARRAGEIPETDLERLHHLTGGNPYFLVETLRVLVAEKAVTADPEQRRWVWNGIGTLTLPESIVTASRVRIDRVSTEVLHIVEEAAVIGDEFRIATLALVDGRSEAELEPLIAEAVRGGLLSIRGVSRGEDCRFQHSILRHVIYDAIAPHRKRRLHASAARATEQLYAAERDRIAEAVSAHWLAAEDARATFEASLHAWQVASGRSEWRKAAAMVERASEAAASLALSASERARLCVAQGETALAKGHVQQASRLLQEAWSLAESLADEPLLARALLVAGRAESAAGRYGAARDLLARARALFVRLAIPQGAFRATIELANVENASGDPHTAVPLLMEVLDGELPDDLIALAQGILGWSLALTGEREESLRLLDRAIDHHGRAGDLRERSLLLRRVESIHRSRGEYENAIRIAVRARADSTAIGDIAGEARANIGIGQARIAQGLEQEGLSFVRRAIERLHELDDRAPRLRMQRDAGPLPLTIVAEAMAMARTAGAAADDLPPPATPVAG